jgi:sugar lactone lactonase YvrE
MWQQPELQVIGEQRDRVGESPVWHPTLQSLYWVDIEGRQIRRFSGAGPVRSWTLPERVGCIATLPDGRVLAAMESRIALVTLAEAGPAQLDTLTTLQHPVLPMRFNDGRCDPLGRLWVGTMALGEHAGQPLGGLYCLDERGLSGPHVSGLITPNGLGFSPDGRTAYLSDSHPSVQKIWAFDFSLEAGTLSNRRLFVDMNPLPGRPDGAAVSADGVYWICANDAGQIHRFTPEGQQLESLHLPFPKPSMCAFGGADLRTLFVTSIVPPEPGMDRSGLSGAVLAVRGMGPGRAEPHFSFGPAA